MNPHKTRWHFITRLLLLGAMLLPMAAAAADLEQDWNNPPRDARLRAYWWWLNGCVTKEAITRDLEEMKAKGFGGALICDADGSAQDGNERAPHGPTFFSPEWRELYKHTLREAARLGLEMSLNIQSGWNLGGPMVTADDAAKKLVWSETRVTGPTKIAQKLPEPASRDNYYRDAFVVAYRLKEAEAKNVFAGLKSCSEQPTQPLKHLADGNPDTFWISTTGKFRVGPSRERPAWVQFEFHAPTSVEKLTILPRPSYGPKECELQVSDDGKAFRTVKTFTAGEKKETVVTFDAVTGCVFRLAVYGAFDRGSPKAPRNVQIAELRLSGKGGSWPDGGAKRRTLLHWEQKAGHRPLHFSAPDTALLFEESPAEPAEEDTRSADVLDLTDKLDKDGALRWNAPAGVWQVLRFGCTIGNHSYVSTCSEGWNGFALDVLDAGAFRRYWDAVVEPLIADAGPLAGKTLKYLHTDSWEVEPLNWTPAMRAEFRKRRGYDMTPWAPALAGRIVGSRAESNKFLHDFRKTLGDLAIDNHYRPFRDGAHRHKLLIHPESGGPHAVPIDAQRCLGFDDAPMSEFWAWSWRHRIGDSNRFFVKQPASAAHTYGRKLVLAEGFTTIGPHWQETLWDNLKPSFDKACCEGLNLLVWHEFVCSPAEQGLPGIQYFAGTHLNPNVTWWTKSAPFFSYLNRCQAMLQRGLFVADACYYYGDHVPNFAQHKRTDPARVLPGYDYDVITEEALLTRATVKDGRIVLPDGMSYRVLVLRDQKAISLPVLRKVKELAAAGATVVGPKPTEAESLRDSDAEVKRIASALPIVTDKTSREVLLATGVKPDFEFSGGDAQTDLDYIHRRDGSADIYFVANRTNRAERVTCTFRVAGKAPELWDAVSGERRFAAAYSEADGRTSLPLEFAPCGSWFVVFREPASSHPATAESNAPQFRVVQELSAPWTTHFVPGMSTPERDAREMNRSDTRQIVLDKLTSWTEHPDPGIKFYSGTASYMKQFDFDQSKIQNSKSKIFLDLGDLRELAEVRLNGKPLGIVWAPPFRVEVTGALKPTSNVLEIQVCNFWPNRIIGDDSLPPEKRLTRTNIRKLTKETPLMPSGLFGPVTLCAE
ncbi:MAG: discoidin domain-containing protein [Verrucomicrobia bacterium]|nr:discoidin domain-containing protein [Verrucomicrobiota bacterium]